MTTQPAQPESAQFPPIPERVSRLEGISEQVNLRLAENTEAINTLRTENHAEHQALRVKIEEQGSELNAKFDRLRGEMHRQTILIVGVLGGLMALLRFAG